MYLLFIGRSHKCILEIPSRLFYRHSLEEFGDPMITRSLISWQQLPQSIDSLSTPVSTGNDLLCSTNATLSSAMKTLSVDGFPLLFVG